MRGRRVPASWRQLLACCVWAVARCTTFTDPPLPTGAVRLMPPAVYARWWAMTETCSGLSRDIGEITWYVVPGAVTFPTNSASEANGYYSRPGAQGTTWRRTRRCR